MKYRKEREAVASTMRRLYRQGLTTCSGGNISFRTADGIILITPSALDKGIINSRQIAMMTLDGENYTPGLKPSIETDMHLKIMKNRPDIRAVVHAHPLHASLLTAAEEEKIPTNILAEARFLLGETVFVPYALMGTADLGSLAAEAAAKGAAALMLENHGVLTVGNTLLQAFDRMEVLEAAAAMYVKARPSLPLRPICPEKLSDIDRMHKG